MASTGQEEPLPIRLVVGLGNPGREYEATRHNAGFMVVERLAGSASWVKERKWDTLIVKEGDRILLKPATYMNASGRAVSAVANFYRIVPEQILVVYDDVDLPLGTLRMRLAGSAGGHNGIKSIIASLGSQDFPRLKVGIGRAEHPGTDTADHVLGKFAPAEEEILQKTLQEAVSALECALARGVTAAMNEFNRKEPARKKVTKKAAPPEEQTPEHPSSNNHE